MPIDARALVLGAAGMLGRYVTEVLRSQGAQVVGLARADFDVLLDPWDKVTWDAYDVVVNCLGAVPQRVSDRDVLRVVNAEFPEFASGLSRRWLQVSTDCVFRGDRGWYTIQDDPDTTEEYGLSKWGGEFGCVLRGSFVGEGGDYGLLSVVLSSDKMNGWVDRWWNGVTCLEFARVISDLVGAGAPKGIHHVAGPERISKFGLCRLIAEAYGHPLELRPLQAGYLDRTLVPTISIEVPLAQQLAEQREYGDRR